MGQAFPISFTTLSKTCGRTISNGSSSAGRSRTRDDFVVDLEKATAEILSFQNDPNFQVGRSHMIDFTLQRSLAGQMIFELGYVGRFGRHLPNSVNFNSVPYMFKDKASGQTFAQAFDAVATELRAGTAPGAVTTQPWFENLIPNGCGGGTSSTACVAGGNISSFQNDNLSNLFLNLDFSRLGAGEQAFTNLQVLDLFTRTSRDTSNYHALVVTLRNNNWHGLYFDLNKSQHWLAERLYHDMQH